MGCDIHAAVEKKVGDKWVMVNRCHYMHKSTDRNYRRFAALAGVRGEGPPPKGLPDDASDSVRLFVDEWGGDGHSHSWMPIKEAARIYLETGYEKTPHEEEWPCSHYFDISDDDEAEYRLVFFFDN